MESELFCINRKKILDQMEEGSVLLSFSRPNNIETHNVRFDINRNYFYLGGVVEYNNIVMLLQHEKCWKIKRYWYNFDNMRIALMNTRKSGVLWKLNIYNGGKNYEKVRSKISDLWIEIGT